MDNIQDATMQWISVDAIDPDDSYARYRDWIALTDRACHAGAFSGTHALHLFAVLHPMVVVPSTQWNKAKRQRYRCIGGIQTYCMARSHLHAGHLVPAIVLPQVSARCIEQMTGADILLTPVLLGVRRWRDMGGRYRASGPAVLALLARPHRTMNGFAHLCGRAWNTIFGTPKENRPAARHGKLTDGPSDPRDPQAESSSRAP